MVYCQCMQIIDIQQKISPILRAHGVRRASVFGSVATGTDRASSDIDLLVRLGKPMGMIAYARFVEQVEDALDRSVDVVTEQSVSPHLRSHIEQDMQVIYES